MDPELKLIGGVTTVYDYGFDLVGGLETVSINGVLERTYVYDEGPRQTQTTYTH